MSQPKTYNLAIETSTRHGSVTLGRMDQIISSLDMPPQRRHRVDLMPTIDAACQQAGVGPADLGEVYVSIGPGSFTGLRIAVATAKTLAQVLGVRLVAVPTVDVVAWNLTVQQGRAAGANEGGNEGENGGANGVAVAVCLNLKEDTVYTRLYQLVGRTWTAQGQAGLLTIQQLLRRAPRPVALLGDPLPVASDTALPDGVSLLDPRMAQPRSEAVWQLGRQMARAGQYADAASLLPLYARQPEAVTLWEKRLADQADQSND